ncbi:MAG: CRISPR-associated endoribonuclease Cas6 [Candidatus Weimeria sp.]
MSGGSSEWVINTLTDEAYEKIIKPLLEPSFDSFVIRQGNIKTKIVSKTLETTDTKELMREFREDQSESNFRIKAVTPVAFRQDGAFNILPLPQLVYQSLMNRYSLLADEISMSDEDILEELASMTLISGYKLRTMRFPLEGNTIPGFVGSFSYYIRKSQTMARYVRMLLRFGEYSGIGVKTGMGMGSIRLIERGEDNAGTGD